MRKSILSMLALSTTSFATIGLEEMPESMKKSR